MFFSHFKVLVITLREFKIKKFKKVYVEITNICNLSCTFCPPKTLPNSIMNLEDFDRLNSELKSVTNEIAYHIVGDPLVLNNLNDYLDISKKHKLQVHLTTAGNNISCEKHKTLSNSAIKQINFSINSYNANSHKKSLEEYLKPIFEFCKYILENKIDIFINFRIWNLDDENSSKTFNQEVFKLSNEFFGSDLDFEKIYKEKSKKVRIARKMFFNFDQYFIWPTLKSNFSNKNGFCYGLNSHFGILSNGTVVPCCLDKDGVINLGNFNNITIKEVLNSNRVKEIRAGFSNGIAVEELCQKCEYKIKFNNKLRENYE